MQYSKNLRVPLRISFTGCATDVPSKIGYYNGMSVCAAIDKFASVSVKTINHVPPGIYPPCELIESLLNKMPFKADIPKMQVEWETDIPLGNGLGGSSSLLVAVASHFFHDPLYQASFASAVEIERGAGWQDAAIAAYGGCRRFNFYRDGFTIGESLSTPDSKHFMLVSLGKTHDTAKQLGVIQPHSSGYIQDNKTRVRKLCKALRFSDYDVVGRVVRDVHGVKSMANPNYLVDGVDPFLDEAMASYGCYGGKILGSGGGGHLLLVIDPHYRERLIELADKFGWTDVPFSFLGDRQDAAAGVEKD